MIMISAIITNWADRCFKVLHLVSFPHSMIPHFSWTQIFICFVLWKKSLILPIYEIVVSSNVVCYGWYICCTWELSGPNEFLNCHFCFTAAIWYSIIHVTYVFIWCKCCFSPLFFKLHYTDGSYGIAYGCVSWPQRDLCRYPWI